MNLKFRIWDKKYLMFDSSEYTDLFIGVDGLVYEKDERSYAMQTWIEYNKVDHYEINQFTGFKDKNETEIYENDIVYFNDFAYDRTGGHVGDNILYGKVHFDSGMFLIATKKGHYTLCDSILNDEELEVVGNIYQNKELLSRRNG